VAIILGIFFAIGVAVGTVVVVAVSALRADRRVRLEQDPPAQGHGGSGEPPPGTDWEGPATTADDRAVWPGGPGNAFRSN
jgi:hypothetical protein